MKPENPSPVCPFCGHEINPVCPYCRGVISDQIYRLYPLDKNEWSLKFFEWECKDCKKRWGETR